MSSFYLRAVYTHRTATPQRQPIESAVLFAGSAQHFMNILCLYTGYAPTLEPRICRPLRARTCLTPIREHARQKTAMEGHGLGCFASRWRGDAQAWGLADENESGGRAATEGDRGLQGD